MAPEKGQAACEELATELLLQHGHPKLHPVVRRCHGAGGLCKELVELLRCPAGACEAAASLPCDPEDLASLGERALELEELEDIVRWQWPNREERQAAHRKLLCCGIDSPQALLRAVTVGSPKRCPLNDLLNEAGFRILRPETISELVRELEVRIRQRIEVTVEGSRPLLVTAPHNIYLQRDGQPPHVIEEYTTLIAQRVARTLGGACLSWSRVEQRRSELLWFLARRQGSEDANAGAYLDPRNRDPNYLRTEEVRGNPWFQQMLRLAENWRNTFGGSRPTLHVDVHGCRDPPCTPSHVTVGLAAMRHEAESGTGPVSLGRLEAFAAALEAELSAAVSGLDLRPRAQLVRVLFPSLQDGGPDNAERLHLSGAWPLEDGRATQSQQAVAFAGFTHSCQLELSKALRRALARDETATGRFARAVNKAWLSMLDNALPPLPRMRTGNSCKGSPSINRSASAAASPLSMRGRHHRSCPPRLRQNGRSLQA